MARFIISNQHQPDDCPELNDEMASHYEAKKPAGDVTVYCNCRSGEHRVFFFVEAAGHAEAMQAVPGGFLRSETTVTEVEEVYKFVAGSS